MLFAGADNLLAPGPKPPATNLSRLGGKMCGSCWGKTIRLRGSGEGIGTGVRRWHSLLTIPAAISMYAGPSRDCLERASLLEQRV